MTLHLFAHGITCTKRKRSANHTDHKNNLVLSSSPLFDFRTTSQLFKTFLEILDHDVNYYMIKTDIS